MKTIIITILIGLAGLTGYSQESLTDTIKGLFDGKQYDEIISNHSANVENYAAKTVYYIGLAYFRKQDYTRFLNLMDLAIKKDGTDPAPFFQKGAYYTFKGQPNHGIRLIKKANKINPNKSSYLRGLGDSYLMKGKLDKALKYYKSATEKEGASDYSYLKIPEIFALKTDFKNALKSLYTAKENISKNSKVYYANTLREIAKYEMLNKEYSKAEIALKELINLVPEDFKSISKIIQIYYHQKEYHKADFFKKKLYKNYSQDALNVDRKKWFCFDKFKWNGKRVHAMEYFSVIENKPNYKHIFYVLTDKGMAEISIQTEILSNAVKSGNPKYVLVMEKDDVQTILPYKFEEFFNYDELKKTVIQVLNEKTNADFSLRKPNK